MRLPSGESSGVARSGFPKRSEREMSGGSSANAAPDPQRTSAASIARIQMIMVPSGPGNDAGAAETTPARCPGRRRGASGGKLVPRARIWTRFRLLEEIPMTRALAVLLATSAAMPAVAAQKLEQPKVVVAVGGRGLFYY